MRRAKKNNRPVRDIACGAAFAGVLLLSGCGGSLYKVKPVVQVPVTEAAGSGRAAGLDVRAVPLLSDEESQELFEANLPLSGLLPVRFELSNESGAVIELKNARFRLRDGEGRQWKARSAKQAISRILDANGVTLYNPLARKRFEEAFSAHALDTLTPLAVGERRQGLIFFQAPNKEAVESPGALDITVENWSTR